MLKLEFFLQSGLLHRSKNGISTNVFLLKTEVSTVKYCVSDVKYYFPRKNLVFGVKTCIFITKTYFAPEKNGISTSFSLEKLRFPL